MDKEWERERESNASENGTIRFGNGKQFRKMFYLEVYINSMIYQMNSFVCTLVWLVFIRKTRKMALLTFEDC